MVTVLYLCLCLCLYLCLCLCLMSAPNVFCRRVSYRQGAYPGLRIIHNAPVDDRYKRCVNLKGLLCFFNPLCWPYCCKADTIFNDMYFWVMENRIEWNVPAYCFCCFTDQVQVQYFDHSLMQRACRVHPCCNCCNVCGESLMISTGGPCALCCCTVIGGLQDARTVAKFIASERARTLEGRAPRSIYMIEYHAEMGRDTQLPQVQRGRDSQFAASLYGSDTEDVEAQGQSSSALRVSNLQHHQSMTMK